MFSHSFLSSNKTFINTKNKNSIYKKNKTKKKQQFFIEATRSPIVRVIDDAQPHSQPPELGSHLLLHQIEAHGHQRQAHEQVDGHARQLVLGLVVRVVDRVAGHEVAEADGAQSDEAEVDAVQDGPLLYRVEDDAAQDDVRAQNEEGHADWHRDFFVVAGVAVVVVVLHDELLVVAVVEFFFWLKRL